MGKLILNFMLVIAVTLIAFLIFNTKTVDAITNYGNINSRIEKNESMYLTANKMGPLTRARYYDKSLKDMYETDYKGMTISQQSAIKTLANTTILNGNGDSMTNIEKVRAFHDWIKDNYYYYRYVNKISKLGDNCDNPYYLLIYEYNEFGKVRSRCNGYAAMLIALARSQGMAARAVEGYYYPTGRLVDKEWGSTVKENTLSHVWVQVYIQNRWVMIDPNADCYRYYDDTTKEYKSSTQKTIDTYGQLYFDITPESLSRTHIVFKYRSGSKEVKYITNIYEGDKLKTFLNKKYSGKTNGKRINSSYTTTKAETWFSKGDTQSLGDGNGKIYKLYLPSYSNLYGSLNLNGFGALQNLKASNNRLTSLYLKNCPSLSTVSASQNKMHTIIVSGAKKLSLLSVQGNPTTYVSYSFNTSRTALIKSTKGGTVSVRYQKVSGKYKHEMKAIAKSGYKFVGWYKGSTRISKYATYSIYKTTSFTYVAKFVKR